jgi:hypothetical protein
MPSRADAYAFVTGTATFGPLQSQSYRLSNDSAQEGWVCALMSVQISISRIMLDPGGIKAGGHARHERDHRIGVVADVSRKEASAHLCRRLFALGLVAGSPSGSNSSQRLPVVILVPRMTHRLPARMPPASNASRALCLWPLPSVKMCTLVRSVTRPIVETGSNLVSQNTSAQ